MKDAASISIAMATFNGERYLAEQLASFAEQTLLPAELVIGDDGSTDGTISIIEQFARHAPFAVHIHRNPQNLGFADNFLMTAGRCSHRWIAFSDQDDVWNRDKLATASAALQTARSGDIVAIGHRVDLVDGDLRPMGLSLPVNLRDGIVARGTMPANWCHGGCALLFDARLVRDIDWTRRPPNLYDWSKDGKPQQRQMAHDQWISLLANTIGSTRLLSASLGLFRRHAGATTGSHLVKFADRLRSARGVDGATYRQSASHALAIAGSLEGLASDLSGTWAVAMTRMAQRYRRRAERLAARARLYEPGSTLDGLRHVIRLVFNAAYGRDPVAALGPRALIKDSLQLLRWNP